MDIGGVEPPSEIHSYIKSTCLVILKIHINKKNNENILILDLFYKNNYHKSK